MNTTNSLLIIILIGVQGFLILANQKDIKDQAKADHTQIIKELKYTQDICKEK